MSQKTTFHGDKKKAKSEKADLVRDLVARVLKGGRDSEAAWSELYKVLRAILLPFLRTWKLEDPEGAFQETMIKASGALPSRAQKKCPLAWFRRIAYNTAVDRYRQLRARNKMEVDEIENPDRRTKEGNPGNGGRTVQDRRAEKILVDEIIAFVRSSVDETKAEIFLYYRGEGTSDGHSVQETADLFGISAGRVSQISKEVSALILEFMERRQSLRDGLTPTAGRERRRRE